MGDKKRVSFQTSVDPTVEEEAMKTFLVFESGDSGDLSYNEFQQAIQNMGMHTDAKQVLEEQYRSFKIFLILRYKICSDKLIVMATEREILRSSLSL